MKSPMEHAPSSRALRQRPRPDGGKALARLELFLAARGLEADVAQVTGKARGGRRARPRRNAQTDIGALYAKTARALHDETDTDESPALTARAAALDDPAAPPPAPFNPAAGPGWRFLGPVYMPKDRKSVV